jgi:hypothetical protein
VNRLAWTSKGIEAEVLMTESREGL